MQTNLFLNKKYEKVDTLHTETGYVTKWHKNNKKINNNYEFFLFKKIPTKPIIKIRNETRINTIKSILRSDYWKMIRN